MFVFNFLTLTKTTPRSTKTQLKQLPTTPPQLKLLPSYSLSTKTIDINNSNFLYGKCDQWCTYFDIEEWIIDISNSLVDVDNTIIDIGNWIIDTYSNVAYIIYRYQ